MSNEWVNGFLSGAAIASASIAILVVVTKMIQMS